MLILKKEGALAGPVLRRPQGGSPEELLLAWLIALPEGVDPARAARIALDGMATSKIESRVQARLRDLLLEVACHQAIHCPAPIGRQRRNKFAAPS